MSHSAVRTLGDIATLTIGRTPPRDVAAYWTNQDLSQPFCSIADMTGRLIRPAREGVTQAAIDAGVAKRIESGTLLMSFKLTVGRVGFADGDLYPNEAIVAIAPDDSVTREFIYYALQAVDLHSLTSDAVKGKTLNLQTLRSIPIPTPGLAEQRRIVDLLSSADLTVTSLTTTHAAAVAAREQVIFAGLAYLATLPDSRLTTLGAVADTQLGKMLNTASQTGEGARPYLRAANIPDWGVVDTSDLRSMDFTDDELERFSVLCGDLLVTEGGAAGRCGVYRGAEPLCFQNHIHRVRADAAATSNEFLALVLEYLSRTGELDRYCSTTTIKMLSSSSLKSVEFSLPSLGDQAELVQAVSACTAKLDSLRAQCEQALHLRNQLLHDLLSGAHEIPETYDRFLQAVES